MMDDVDGCRSISLSLPLSFAPTDPPEDLSVSHSLEILWRLRWWQVCSMEWNWEREVGGREGRAERVECAAQVEV